MDYSNHEKIIAGEKDQAEELTSVILRLDKNKYRDIEG